MGSTKARQLRRARELAEQQAAAGAGAGAAERLPPAAGAAVAEPHRPVAETQRPEAEPSSTPPAAPPGKKRKRKDKPPPAAAPLPEAGSTVGPCNVCGRVGHLGRTCPTRACRKCGGFGHIAKHCAGPKGAECSHCGSQLHAAAECTFGALPGERYLFCAREAEAGACGCFSRHFVIPMRLARTDFAPRELRQGRMDVGCSCVSAALFRSQSLRGNTCVSLCFKEEAQRLEVRGASIRRLQPDDFSVAVRLHAAMASPAGPADGVGPGGEVCDAAAYSQSDRRGFLLRPGSTEEAVRAALAESDPPPAVLLLHARGEPIEAACARLQPLLRRQAGEGGAARGVVVVLGDDRGLLDDDEALVARLAGEAGAPLLRVSLGGVVLFSSHSIVLLHHYLDKLLHACALRPPRDLLAKAKGVLGGPSYKGSYKG